MNRNITISLPRNSQVRRYIQNKYTDLFFAWKRANPTSTLYTQRKLRQNIRQALSIHGQTFKEEAFNQTEYAPWGKGLDIKYGHWFYLVNISIDKKGRLIALVIDACYEGDYHNDTMNTTPYGETRKYSNRNIISESKGIKNTIRLTESQFKQMLVECIYEVLNKIA